MFKALRLAAFIIFAAASSVWAAPVAVSSTEARDWATSKGQELLTVLAEPDLKVKYAKLDKMMNEDVNLDYISKFVIGKYAKLMNNEQRLRYNDLFHRYVLSLYRQIDMKFDTGNINFSIDNITEHPGYTTVDCIIDPGEIMQNLKVEKLPVKFKLIRGKADRIQAVDVEIADVSMVIEYRKRFYQMIREENEDIDWFLEKFDDKVKANEKSFQKRAGI